MDHTDKVVGFIEECRVLGLAVSPPDINRSGYRFQARDQRQILYGLGAIKGVGESALQGILEERRDGGVFADLFDFCRRIDLRKVNRRVLESLVRAGALDGLGANRATLMMQLPLALRMAEQHQQQKAAGQVDLFGLGAAEQRDRPELGIVPEGLDEWDEEQRLQGEKETLGLFLTGHPIEFYEMEIRQGGLQRIADFSLDSLQGAGGNGEGGYRGRGRPASLMGLVIAVQRRNTQRGAIASVLLDDRTGRMEATLFNEMYERHRDLLAVDRVLLFEGQVIADDYRGGVSLRVERVATPEDRRADQIALIDLRVPEPVPEDLVAQLRETLQPHLGGSTGVRLRLRRPWARATITLGSAWRVRPSDELLRQLRRRFGDDSFSLLAGAVRPAGVDEVASAQQPAAALEA
jgi:DNA polymerase-3 subunit alpha